MSDEKDLSENGNISHIPVEQVNELAPPGIDNAGEAEAQEPGLHPVEVELPLPENDDAEAELQEAQLLPVEAELPPIENIDRREPEELEDNFNPVDQLLEVQELHLNPVETESKDSGHDSPLQGAVGYRDLANDSVLEGAGSGVVNCDCGAVHFTPEERMRIKAEKEDLFRKFFSKEYDDPMAPILGRQRHPARKQRVRQRHVSEDSKLSDPNPLGCLQDEGTSSGAILNQAGAIIGKNIPKEEIPEYKRFGTEFGQSLPLLPRPEGSEVSISSIETARIAEVYGGAFSRPPSDDRGLSPGLSFPSFSSRPPTAASSDLKISPPLDSELPEMDKQSPTPEENVRHEQPARQRRFGVTTLPVALRSKSALAGPSSYPSESDAAELQLRKLSKDMSVCSEPLPQRKISKDSSVGYSEQSLEDEMNYPELAHSLENDSCMPMPDIDPAVVESLDSLTLSDIPSSAVVQNVGIDQETEQSEVAEQVSATNQSFTHDAAGSPQPQSD